MLATDLLELFGKMDDDAQSLLVIALGAAVITATCVLIHAWKRVKQSEQRTLLTSQMLARGMSADEITKVLISASLAAGAEVAPAAADPEVRIVRILTDQSYDRDAINRILAAARIDASIDAPTIEIVRTLAESWTSASNIVNVLNERRNRRATAPDSFRAEHHR